MAMSDPLVIDELVRFRASTHSATSYFRQAKHNRVLCPMLERQLHRIEDCFVKYRRAAYNVQGIHDQGTDIVFRYEEASESRYVSFQIKSYDDLANPRYLKDLKASRFEAGEEYQDNLECYYVFLCTDYARDSSKIAEVKKAFSKDSQVTVIAPEYALSFLGMQQTRMAAIIDALLRSDDYVFQEASRLLAELSPTQIAVLLATAWTFVEHRSLLVTQREVCEISFVRNMYAETIKSSRPNDASRGRRRQGPSVPVESRLAVDLDILDGTALHLDDGTIRLDARATRALQATILDAMIRYDMTGDDLLAYIDAIAGTQCD